MNFILNTFDTTNDHMCISSVKIIQSWIKLQQNDIDPRGGNRTLSSYHRPFSHIM